MSQWGEKHRTNEGQRQNFDIKVNMGLDWTVCGKGMCLSSMTFLIGDIFQGCVSHFILQKALSDCSFKGLSALA